jgi:hypothetical protein
MKLRIQYFLIGVGFVIVDNYIDVFIDDISFEEATDSILSTKGIIYALLFGLALALLYPRWYEKRGRKK